MLQAEILQRLKPSGAGRDGGGRRRAGDLFVPRRDGREHPRVSRSSSTHRVVALEENYRSTQQILDAANALIGKSLYSKKKLGAKPRYVTVADDEGAGAVRGDARAGSARARRAAAEPGGPLPRLAPLRPARARARAAQHPLREVRRPQVPRGGARQGPARGAALGGQPEEPHRGVSRAAAPARRRAGGRGARLHALRGRGFFFQGNANRVGGAERAAAPTLPTRRGKGRCSACASGTAAPRADLRLGAGARGRPAAAGEDRGAVRQTREPFLTEMALDPPSATSDLSGEPYLDEDYLVLSTVHSAKGQEWEAVHILNVADGNFPSEFATGRRRADRRGAAPALRGDDAREERARTSSRRSSTTWRSQSRMGDRHVYGAKSRFMTQATCWRAWSRWPGARRAKARTSVRPREAWTWPRLCAGCGPEMGEKKPADA